MPVPEWTEDQLRTWVDGKYDEEADGAWVLVQRWLDRGDGAAVYENHDLGHSQVGAPQVVSYGSATAQLEPPRCVEHQGLGPEHDWCQHPEYPPARLPDIGGAINWRYTLIATCRRPS